MSENIRTGRDHGTIDPVYLVPGVVDSASQFLSSKGIYGPCLVDQHLSLLPYLAKRSCPDAVAIGLSTSQLRGPCIKRVLGLKSTHDVLEIEIRTFLISFRLPPIFIESYVLHGGTGE